MTVWMDFMVKYWGDKLNILTLICTDLNLFSVLTGMWDIHY